MLRTGPARFGTDVPDSGLTLHGGIDDHAPGSLRYEASGLLSEHAD